MEIYNLENDIKVFGMQVKSFPAGIGEAFEALVKMISEGFNRSFFGISRITEKRQVIYIAAAEESFEGEAEKYNCDRYVIEKGEYLMVLVRDWRKKTGCIKDVFHEMMQDTRFDNTKPCIEWYKNDEEMLCMLKTG